MSSTRVSPADIGATDIFASPFAAGRSGSGLGLDVECTKAAVDLQNMAATSSEAIIRASLDTLCRATGADGAFLALLDPNADRFEKVTTTIADANQLEPATPAGPATLEGEELANLPFLASRFDHLRLTEYRDTSRPAREEPAEAARLASMGFSSVLLVALHMQKRPAGVLAVVRHNERGPWDVNYQLLLKLIGTSLATGMERLATATRLAEIEERNALVDAASNDGLWDFNFDTNDLYLSPRWKAMMGYEDIGPDEIVDWRGMVHPDDLSRVQDAMFKHVSGAVPLFESVHRMRHRNGEYRWVISRAKGRIDKQGRLQRLLGVELDITERKLYEEALFREKEAAQITLQAIGDGVITTDADSVIDYINPVAETLTGWRLEDAMGRSIDEVFRAFHEETCEPLENPLTGSIRRTRPMKSARPVLMIRRDGNELYVESTAAPIRDGGGRVCGAVLVFHDVSESRELNRKLTYHASHDPLTGLVNRREFENRIERCLKSARAQEGSYSLCHLDIDQFKMINDSCGHAAGDTLLGQIGALLKSKIRWRDTLSRLGGDEYGVLLESSTLDDALRIAEVMRETVKNFRFEWEDRVFKLSASVGVVPITAENDDVASILSAAEGACAAAKEQGRNRVHSFAENDIELMRRRRETQWAARISAALDEGRFELYRMPIMPLQAKEEGEHYEILVRMRDEAGKIISPDHFIAAAERYNITPAIDRWVLENTLRWLVSEADERERLLMCAINLSGQSLGDDKFLPFVIEQFQKSGLDASKICFEITETAAVASFSQANRFIKSLKELGCKFSLDDFGTGLSSFGYLKHFPVDYLKIDGSFVRGILTDPIDREMVRSINEIGHLTGKLVIAEFAENQEIIQTLASLGVDYAQGYGIAQPSRLSKAPVPT
ncbi:MAG TPA: EAL domain-containing protein [Steroidobacteraceae bacterium]|nr:EAL domain-containing protein [Steroidobacteraceae bacterium]